MLRKNALGFLLLLMGMNILITSCQDGDDSKKTQPPVEAKVDSLSTAQLNELKKIFFSIPSPAEMATLIEEKGYQFDQGQLVPTANVDKYVGEARQAIMLGIYGADLSYTSIFNQKQATTEYFAASQKLARQMQIDGIITPELIERMEKNQNDREAMLNIVSEAYADMNDYLKEKQRFEISALVVAGGWLEALYLSTLYSSDGTNEIRQRIAEQKYSLNNLLTYLEKFGDNGSIKEMKADLIRLKEAYNPVEENKGKTTAAKDQSGTMVIGTSTKIVMDDAALQAITSITSEIRAKYTAL
ncbi:MAG: hypothetical protein ACKO7B_14665 [Flavobacteriales bacterium]